MRFFVFSVFIVFFFITKNVSSMSDYETIIVGGGLSGLRAARGLRQAGKEFLLIEARDRLGGRALSIGDPHLEAGAEWVEKEHHAMHQLAENLGVKLERESKAKGSILIHRNRMMPPEEFPRPFQRAYKKLNGLPKPHVEDLGGTVNETLLHYLARKGVSLIPEEMEAINYVLRNDPGVDLANVSHAALSYIRDELKDYFKESENEEEEYIFVNGTRSLVEAMGKEIGQERIRLSSPLQRLMRDGEGIYHLQLEESELTAKQLILTLPFSVLRSEYGILDDVTLGIPLDVRHVMDTMPYGSNASILIPCDVPIDIEYNNLDQQVSAWTRPGGVRITIGGGRAKGLTRESPEIKAILEKAHDKLRHDDVKIEGKPIHFVNWATDPYTRGSYSAYWLTQAIYWPSVFNEHMHWFASPLNHNTLFFNGEHTMLNSAYMESAVISGQIVTEFLTTITE